MILKLNAKMLKLWVPVFAVLIAYVNAGSFQVEVERKEKNSGFDFIETDVFYVFSHYG